MRKIASRVRHSARLTRRELLAGAAAALHASAAKGGVSFLFGTYGTKPLPLPDAFEAIAKAGYDGVQLAVMPDYGADAATLDRARLREIRALLQQHRLAIPAVLDSLPLIAAPARLQANRERLRRIAEAAHGLADDAPVLDTVLGGKTAEWPTVRGRMIEELMQWARIAEEGALTIAIKAHADQAVNTPGRLLELLRAANSPRIRVVYDYSHFSLEGLSLEESLRPLLSHTALISVKDARGTRDQHEYLLPGDGSIDYLAYFRLLARSGYRGPIGVEVSSMLHRAPGYDPVQTANLCYRRLAPRIAEAGLPRRNT